MFVKSDTILDRILTAKTEMLVSVTTAMRADAERAAQVAPRPRPFEESLRRRALDEGTVALIAEVKHASPSKGILIDPFDPVALAQTYAANGATALSILTDEPFFTGHLDHLRAARRAVDIPVLRKDFIIDRYQVDEGRAAGADAMLLIVMALEDAHLADLHAHISGLGMTTLVEVHDEAELERALKIGATLIGVNNRDLRTFREDVGLTGRLASRVPDGVTLVAESAIRHADDARAMGAFGAHAVLVGEGLLKSADIGAATRAFASQVRVISIAQTHEAGE